MSCDNSTYCTTIVDCVPCSSLATRGGGLRHASRKSTQQSRRGLTADRSKLKGHRHEVQSRIIPNSTQVDPEYVWGDEGPINE